MILINYKEEKDIKILVQLIHMVYLCLNYKCGWNENLIIVRTPDCLDTDTYLVDQISVWLCQSIREWLMQAHNYNRTCSLSMEDLESAVYIAFWEENLLNTKWCCSVPECH